MNITCSASTEALTIAQVCAILGISAAPWARDNQENWFVAVLGATELSHILGDYCDVKGLYPEHPPTERWEWLDQLTVELAYCQAITKAKEAACASI